VSLGYFVGFLEREWVLKRITQLTKTRSCSHAQSRIRTLDPIFRKVKDSKTVEIDFYAVISVHLKTCLATAKSNSRKAPWKEKFINTEDMKRKRRENT
jgi:hypothetical protein